MTKGYFILRVGINVMIILYFFFTKCDDELLNNEIHEDN